jgi:hypothetical protein
LHSVNRENQTAPLFKTARASVAETVGEVSPKQADLASLLEKLEIMSDAQARDLKEKLLKSKR